jgi:uncharacterized membrane protein
VNKVMFATFDNEEKAYEAERALHQMHDDGVITWYDDAVVAKDASGKVVVRNEPTGEPIATVSGMIAGGLIGLLGGPIGSLVGVSAGTLVGAAFDLAHEGIDSTFVRDIGQQLETGKTTLIAHIDESWQVPVDTRMNALGGKVVRRTLTQIEDARLERDLEASQKELANLEAEQIAAMSASEAEKTTEKVQKIDAKIAAAKKELAGREAALAKKLETVKAEGKDKIDRLEAQKATVTDQSKILLDRRIADVRADYQDRIDKLGQALERRKSANATAAA